MPNKQKKTTASLLSEKCPKGDERETYEHILKKF
jgi:hypothetical protein